MASLPPPPLYDGPPPATSGSASEAITPAWQHMKYVLFETGSVRKWLALALIAFLAGATSGGGGPSGNFRVPGPTGPSGPSGGGPGGWPREFERAWQELETWAHGHVTEIVVLGVGLTLLAVGLGLLFMYLGSVFRFIFTESVITNEIHLRESWRRNEGEGRALFWWMVGFGLIILLVVGLFVGVPFALLAAAGGAQGGGFVLGLLFAMLVMFALALVIGVIVMFTEDFVVPVMYLRRIGTMAAWQEFWGVLCANKMGFFIYVLLKIVCGLVAALAAMVGLCFGMLIAAIPIGLLVGLGYLLVMGAGITAWSWSFLWVLVPVGMVLLLALSYWITCVLLPIPVFFRSYSLKYLGMVAPEWRTV